MRAMNKKKSIILALVFLLLAYGVVAMGPLIFFFPAYVPILFLFYVGLPLYSHALILVGSLLACILGGISLLRWPVAQLRYAAVPAAVMGLATAWLPPQACGFDPLIFNTFSETMLYVGAAALVASVKSYNAQVCATLALFCGIVVGLQIHVDLCHNDYRPDAGLIAVSSRSGVWLAVLAAMALGWLSAWFGTRIYRLMPSARV